MVEGLGFPRERLPLWADVRPDEWWQQVFVEFGNGIVAQPYLRLISEALERYSANRVFLRLSDRYGIGAATHRPAASGGDDPQQRCHVIVRIGEETGHADVLGELSRLGLGPEEVWSTAHAVSYEVASADAEHVRETLRQTSLGFLVVPPGRPDYLYSELFVQGPDGSQYRITDAPAQQTFRDIADGVVGHYEGDAETPDASTQPTVIDRVLEDSPPERVNPDDTLHDAGVQDGDALRVGFERRAGAVNPIDREDALDRGRKQLLSYAQSRPDVSIRANSVTLPTEYEIDFTQDSFQPPEVRDGGPTHISRHTVLLTLGPEFPATAPHVFWLSPIFHPNVFPNYDCEQLRDQPNMQGLVCLGALADSWSPSFDLGQLLQMLIDMAGFRNYELVQLTPGMGGERPQVHANFYDGTAARWALAHQAEITAIGGASILPRSRRKREYPNVIERIS